jgi:hypothetical protein
MSEGKCAVVAMTLLACMACAAATAETNVPGQSKPAAAPKMTWDKLPDWSGIWVMEGRIIFDNSGKDPHRQFPPLKPEYEAKYAAVVKDAIAGKEFDPLTHCLPAGFPRVLAEPFLQEFVLRPEQVWWIHEQQNEIRRIYTDGRGHPPPDELYPLWEGHSIGHWEGDTLVVDSISLREGIYDRTGAIHSDKAHITERIRKVDPSTIEDQIVVEDPVTLTRPWHVLKRYKKLSDPALRIDHWACEEDNRAVFKEGSTDLVLPGEPGYKESGEAGFREQDRKKQQEKKQ